MHREYSRVRVVCMDIPKIAACERRHTDLRTVLGAREIKNCSIWAFKFQTAPCRGMSLYGIRTQAQRERFFSMHTCRVPTPKQSRLIKATYRASGDPTTTPRWIKNCFAVGWGARNTKSPLGTTPLPLRAENLVPGDGTGQGSSSGMCPWNKTDPARLQCVFLRWRAGA